MDSNQDIENQEPIVAEIVDDSAISIEDFIRQLELREKDLDITANLAIEIDEADFDDTNPPEFIKQEFKIPTMTSEPLRPLNLDQTSTYSDLEDEVRELKQKLAKLDDEKTEMARNFRRRQFDFDNFKKRVERERGDSFLSQLANLGGQMLPVLDNLDRALAFAEQHSDGKTSDFNEFFRGIVLVNQQLNEIFAEMGIDPIASVGETFDPNFHEAVAAEQRTDVAPNTITAELLRGYRINDKVIRAAMVRVAVAPRSPVGAVTTEISESPDTAE